jgi:hypothetical protein
VPPRHRPPRAFVIQVALAGFVIIAVAVAIGLVTGAPTGTVADWVAGISTFAALIAAIFAAWYAAQAFGVETRREDRFAEQQRVAQAALVAGWTGEKTFDVEWYGPPNKAMESLIPKTHTVDGVWLRNASDVPVTSVQYRLYLADEPCAKIRMVGTVPPGDEPTFVSDHEDDREIANPSVQIIGGHYRVALSFKDAAGRRWYRHPDGELEEGPPPWE